jgi:broad specificity phosphatase PhoE
MTTLDGAVTTCYLTRHCDVANPRRVLYGHLPNFGLSTKGQEQGRALGRLLRESQVAAVYTSPLQRALETAALLVAGLPTPVQVIERADLIEAEFGRYLQGTRYKDVLWRKPRWWVHMAWPGLVHGDESMRQMHDRVDRVVREGLKAHPGETFVCISHGDPIQAFWATLDRRPPWALHRLQCAKGGTLRLRYQEGRLLDKAYLAPDTIAAYSARSSSDQSPASA